MNPGNLGISRANTRGATHTTHCRRSLGGGGGGCTGWKQSTEGHCDLWGCGSFVSIFDPPPPSATVNWERVLVQSVLFCSENPQNPSQFSSGATPRYSQHQHTRHLSNAVTIATDAFLRDLCAPASPDPDTFTQIDALLQD